METTTTTTCVCNGSGVIHEYDGPGILFIACGCYDPEKRRIELEELKRVVNMRMKEIEGIS